jgi:hypothetical protein
LARMPTARGLLTGLGIMAIPGVGPVVAAGWLVTTLAGAAAGGRGDADVAEIAGAVPRGYVHAATQRHREMSEVAAHASPLYVGLVRGLGRAGVSIAKGDAIVDIVADRLHKRPTLPNLPEKRPRAFSRDSVANGPIGAPVRSALFPDILQIPGAGS